MSHRNFWSLVVAFLVVTGCSDAQSEPVAGSGAAAGSVSEWTEDIDGAFRTAAEEKKPVFINFTGSDWCYWCKVADKNIFSTKEWKAFAGKFVCLKVDFPRGGAPDVMTMKKRQDFAGTFAVRGYPTFVLADAGRKQLARFSAGRKDAQTFIGEVKSALEQNVK
jgi:protein disulfide-isomerase